MATLTRAHNELFRRNPDERFTTFAELYEHCESEKERSLERWENSRALQLDSAADFLQLQIAENGKLRFNNWSFTQLCTLSRINRDTVNRLTPDTAKRVFDETLPRGTKPIQLLTLDGIARSIHGTAYTRLYNAELMSVVNEFSPGFIPSQTATGGGTGLYCGEQDMFCFLIDPTGWAEIDGQSFAPGFFLWNSEVGRRTVGVQTFWFQAVCQNHIVWDAVEVVDFTRKHTTNVHEALDNIRKILHDLTKKRDERRDSFVKVIRKAMRERFGTEDENALKLLGQYGINRSLAEQAIKIAKSEGGLTIFAVVDALTRLSQRIEFAGDRTQADTCASQLLALAA